MLAHRHWPSEGRPAVEADQGQRRPQPDERRRGIVDHPFHRADAGKVEADGGARPDRPGQPEGGHQARPGGRVGRRRRRLRLQVDGRPSGEVDEVLAEGVEVHVPAGTGDGLEILTPVFAREAAVGEPERCPARAVAG